MKIKVLTIHEMTIRAFNGGNEIGNTIDIEGNPLGNLPKIWYHYVPKNLPIFTNRYSVVPK